MYKEITLSFTIRKTGLGLVGWLAGVDSQYQWVVEGKGHGQGHGQGHIMRGFRTICGLAVGGGFRGITFV